MFIAVYVNDSVLRPYGGDVLAVIFLYCLLKSILEIPVKNTIFGVLVFAFLLEGLQALELVQKLQLQGNAIASAVLGSHFDPLDLLLYCLGGLLVFMAEKFRNRASEKAISQENCNN